MNKPLITVSILSWLLEDRLIQTLRGIPISTDLPLHLCLQVQGTENISDVEMAEIIDAASGFASTDIFFTEGNQWTAKPRAALLQRSCVTPFVLITDNDMDFQPGSIDALYNFLISPSSSAYGAANLLDSTVKWHRRVELAYKRVTYFPVSTSPPRVVDVDLCGACALMLRQSVAALPGLIDPGYDLGTWDIDLCMNIRALGLKIATICDKSLIAINDTSQRTPKYLSIKGMIPLRNKGIKRFFSKWGFSPEVSREEAIASINESLDTAIITRAIYTSLDSTPGIGVLTPIRLEAMQNFFINSLKNQTNKSFKLYIFTGPASCEPTKTIQSLDWTGLDVTFLPIEDDLSTWDATVQTSGNWGREIDFGCPEDLVRRAGHPLHTIMARLDNDDWVAPGWVAHMKHLAATTGEPGFLINYQVIGQWKDGRLYNFWAKHSKQRTSPFITLVQRSDLKFSPYAKLHLQMGSLFSTVLDIPPGYVFMVVHGENRSNRLYKDDYFIGDKPNNVQKLPVIHNKKVIDTRKPVDDWKSRIKRSAFKN